MNDDEVPRTVWFEIAEVFLRRTLRLSGDRGGGGGAAKAGPEPGAGAEAKAKDRVDFVGDVVSARDDLDPDLVGDFDGTRSSGWFGGDCSID